MAASPSPEPPEPQQQLTPELWHLLNRIVQNPREMLDEDPELARQLALDARRLSPKELHP